MTGPSRVEECTAYLQGGRLAVRRLRRHVTHRPGGGEPSEEAPPSGNGGVPRAVGGASPRHDWSLPLFLFVLIGGSLLWLALLMAGEHIRCAHHTGQAPAYCNQESTR